MIRYAWTSYEKHAWGFDELESVSKAGSNWYGSYSLLSTPVDSLDTLLLANLTAEYTRAKDLVLSKLEVDIPIVANVFETTIRVLGGLLSAYELDGDWRYVQKAVELADRLLPAFETPTGIPVNKVKLSNGEISKWTPTTALAEAGTLALEFQYLSDVTGDPKYGDAALFAMDQIWAQDRPVKGLIPLDVNLQGMKSTSSKYGVAGAGDSYYEYLLKLWISTKETRFRDMYLETADAISKHLVKRSSNGQNVYIPDANMWNSAGTQQFSSQYGFHHLSCFAGGMFGLGTVAIPTSSNHWEISQKITETCYLTYHNNDQTGLGFEIASPETLRPTDPGYASLSLLRPETVESIFYMWRLTHDPKYREWGWEIAQNIEKYGRPPNGAGYSGLNNARSPNSFNNKQESFYIAETLKYLLLLFSSDDVLPLDRYVFNTEAHPIAARGIGRRRDPTKWVGIPEVKSRKGGDRAEGAALRLQWGEDVEIRYRDGKVVGKLRSK
ncbi:hypothetical protein HK102_004163 [Quaeritorhiza haematococci]|nr:hypothetical protein HK102_004163 [Quaeritorhiza haematococci]